MPKTLEQGATPFTTWLGNFTALPTEWIVPLASIQWCFGRDEAASSWSRLNLLRLRVNLGYAGVKSLFWNGLVFIRLALPLWLGLQIRFRHQPGQRSYLQAGLGWKLNGRLALLFRVQSDESAARGTSGPNYGQAQGWADGPK